MTVSCTKIIEVLFGFGIVLLKVSSKFFKDGWPLYELARKDLEFLWKPVHDLCITKFFCCLKQLLIIALILAYPDFTEDFLETDASGIGLGGILAQGDEDGIIYVSYCICQ